MPGSSSRGGGGRAECAGGLRGGLRGRPGRGPHLRWVTSGPRFSLSVACLRRSLFPSVPPFQVLASLLDMVYRSDEKEKAVPLISRLLYYVFPYLRNHR